MKEIKKYMNITRYGKTGTSEVLNKGDYITITEKIDGANASFCLDNENPLGVSCYSRNKALSEEDRLRGYYDWILNNIVPIKEKLNPTYRYIGEWLCPHKVAYKEECYKNFYLFSIWNEETEQYVSDSIVQLEAKRLNLKTPEYFYEGKYISFEHLMSFVGKSNMTLKENTGEGIVVKNSNYFDKYGKQMFVKLVSEGFAEVQKQKLPKNPKINQAQEILKYLVTVARVDKLIHKLIDEGLLKEDLTIKDMGDILRLLGNRVLEDIYKEEDEYLVEFEEENIKKSIGKYLPTIVKEILNNK